MKVKNCMSEEVTFIYPNCSIKDCAKIMCDNHIGFVPICDESKKVVGVVTDRDILLRTVACDKDVKNTPVSDIMTTRICSCTSDSDLQVAEKIMSENQVRRLPIIDDDKIVGIITLGDLASNNNIDCSRVGKTLENICGCDKRNCS